MLYKKRKQLYFSNFSSLWNFFFDDNKTFYLIMWIKFSLLRKLQKTQKTTISSSMIARFSLLANQLGEVATFLVWRVEWKKFSSLIFLRGMGGKLLFTRHLHFAQNIESWKEINYLHIFSTSIALFVFQSRTKGNEHEILVLIIYQVVLVSLIQLMSVREREKNLFQYASRRQQPLTFFLHLLLGKLNQSNRLNMCFTDFFFFFLSIYPMCFLLYYMRG